MNSIKLTAIALLGMIAPSSLWAQSQAVKKVKLTQFNLQSSSVITDAGKTISDTSYQSRNYWFPVTVPSTVLTGLVANHVYPDPYIGMNNMLIPDASDTFNTAYHLAKYSFLPNEANPWKKPYWYRTTFKVPASDKGKLFQLIFKGINYRAEVWVNGQQIADSSEMAGMFAQYALDVSRAIYPGKRNVLAVKIFPLDYPGVPAPPQLKALGDFFANGGPTGDIGKNVTMLCSVGWDWMPAVRDRNMGIWQPVYLRTSGTVTIDRPQVTTTLPRLPDTTLAEISLKLNLVNHGNSSQSGKLMIKITPESFPGTAVTISRDVRIDAGASRDISLDAKSVKQLTIKHPHLWWPNGYGRPDLYRLQLQYVNANGDLYDDTSFVFGIRQVGSKVDMVDGWARRSFYVNGQRIHLVGGAWVPDMMLNRDSLRYDQEIRLCRNANINLLRIWGGGVTPPDEFFELADRYGMLVWQDFWVTGDTQGEFKGSPDWPLESNVFIRNMTSTIYRIRNHPSLLLWTGGNEGHARKALYDAMRDSVISLDGTRPFIPSSSGYAKLPEGWKGSWPDDGPSGVYSGGPYSWQDPAVYYQKVNAGKDWLFKDETGIPSQPPYASLARIIPDLVPDSTLPYPLNNTWGYHDACTGNGHYEQYYEAMEARYGKPASMRDFSDKMQLVNANGYRGIFESAGHKLNETGGVMLWKLNAAFPSVIWQVYDWYLEPNSGYYFMQRACEPVHIQLNLDDSAVAVINRTYHPSNHLTALIDVLDLQGKNIYHKQMALNSAATSVAKIQSVAEVLRKTSGISFVVLRLKDASGKIISHNTYWVEEKHNYTGLKNMPQATVKTELLRLDDDGNDKRWIMKFTNTSVQLAFFIQAQLQNNGKEILPAYWSDNYFSLAPGESIEVRVSCSKQVVTDKPQVEVSGWNLETARIALQH